MKKNKVLLGLLFVSAVAWACTDYEFVGEVNVGTVDSRDDVAEALQEQFGDDYPEGTRVSMVVRFILQPGTTPLGTFSMPLTKECDEKLDEAYEAQIAINTTPTGSGGGGSIYFPHFPRPFGPCGSRCGTGTVEVGEVKPT
ncbi:hypothetical protein [Arenimonas sp. MALMAid1274]|uniref:hypothetical protein n=1 Tax=Arenimonas sp. MALMAid1274 TaxID=3411630 RepID=UPI003B9E2383